MRVSVSFFFRISAMHVGLGGMFGGYVSEVATQPFVPLVIYISVFPFLKSRKQRIPGDNAIISNSFLFR